MEAYKAGDLITFRLHDQSYGLARIVHTEHLALHELYHLEILDAVVTAEDEGVDSYGLPYERSHALDGAERAPVVIDHIALTREAFAESSPAKVGHAEVDEAALEGYRLWLHITRTEMIKRGQIRERDEEEPEDEYLDEEFDEFEEEEEIDGDAEEPGDQEDDGEAEEEQEEEGGAGEVTARAWHAGEYSRPLVELLFEPNFRQELSAPELKDGTLARYINGFFDGDNSGKINEMVARFADGDYGAGHELMAFGEPAADALGELLRGSIAPELADDVLNVLCDMGNMRAYEHVAAFFTDHEPNADDPLALSAARGFCYAVMLTGGTPDPLRERLERLGEIDAVFPELAHDVHSAREAAANAAPQETEAMKPATNAPFGTL